MIGRRASMPEDNSGVGNPFKNVTEGVNWGFSVAEIANRFWHTNDARTRRFLAGVVLDELRPVDMRLAAYCALFEVCGRELRTLPPINEFKIPDDFNLRFLNECLKNEE